MAYTKTVWQNDSAPAISDTNLNKIEDGLDKLHNGGASNGITLDASGNVGIGTSSPSDLLHLVGDTKNIIIGNTSETKAGIVFQDYGVDVGQTASVKYDSGANALVFCNNSSTTERMRIDSLGNVSINNGNLSFANGKGIDFSADGNASGMTSELLDDYEEGTWTPTLPNGGTLSFAGAYYVKVGSMVTAYAYIQNIAPTNDSSEFNIGGLPFNAYGIYGAGSIGYMGDSNIGDWRYNIQTGGNFLAFHVPSTASRRTNAQYISASSGLYDHMIITITYRAI